MQSYNGRVASLRDVLNRLRWDPHAAAASVFVEVLVREGDREGVCEVRFADVTEILPGGVTVADGTFLPYHRVVRVRRDGEVLWASGRR